MNDLSNSLCPKDRRHPVSQVSNPLSHSEILPYLDKGYPCVISGLSTVWEEAKEWSIEKRFAKGQIFSFDGENTASFVYVKSGVMHCILYEGNGASRTNLICQRGSLINETCTVTRSISTKFIFLCRSQVTLYSFSEDIPFNEKFILKFPHLIRNMFLSSAIKLLHVQALLNAICTRSTLHLVCWYIYSMVMHHHGATEFSPGISQSDIIALLGLSRTSMKRSMAYLRNEDIVTDFTKCHLTVRNLDRLRELALPGG